MQKIWAIAVREYRAMVGTKAFLLSVTMMPILMLGSVVTVSMLKNSRSEDRKIAVIDQTGRIYAEIQKAVERRNSEIETPNTNDKTEDFGDTMASKLFLEPIAVDEVTDELRMQLSNQIREKQFYAFVEIPPEVIETTANQTAKIKYYSEDSGLSEVRAWFEEQLNEIVRNLRLLDADIDLAKVTAASQRVDIRGLGLMEKSSSGEVSADEKDAMSAIFLPMGVMMFMFMVIFLAAQPALESVLEEKSQRIAEVLLGSANPFQLMLGKLLGTVAGSLTVFGIYLIGGVLLAQNRGWTDLIPFHLVPWFITFQILGVMFYASVFMAVGASVTQLKEAQAFLLPVWMVMMIPFFVWFSVVREPNSTLAVGLSFFPPATPSMMVLRLATGQSIPLWQPLLGIVVCVLATLTTVFISARIFRAGLLWQGNMPKLSEIFRWALRG